MEIVQIVIEPGNPAVGVVYTDAAGRLGRLECKEVDPGMVASLLETAAGWLPQPQELPDREDVEAEIGQLEQRLAALQSAIGEG